MEWHHPRTSETLKLGSLKYLSSFALDEDTEMQRGEVSRTDCEEPCKQFGLYKQLSL